VTLASSIGAGRLFLACGLMTRKASLPVLG